MQTLVESATFNAVAEDQLGRTLKDLRISVTDQCNFRCPHCMPKEKNTDSSFLKPNELLGIKDIVRIARLSIALGVQKIRLTGGEPLLRPDIFKLIASLKALDGLKDIALTTNGFFLSVAAAHLKKAGLQRLTVSLDALDDKTFQVMCGETCSVQRILKGIRSASEVGFDSIKINIVIRKGINDKNLLDFVDFFRHRHHVVRFIEFMDVGTQNNWQANDVVASLDVYRQIHKKYPLVPLGSNHPGEVARRYAFKDGQGEIGFISAITQPFCRDCCRLRLSPDGKLYSCLFAGDGLNLKSLMCKNIDDESLLRRIIDFWLKRKDNYSEKRFLSKDSSSFRPKIEMYQIGG